MNAREDAVIINSLVRQALASAREVMGDNGLNAVLGTSGLERFIDNFPPNNLEPSIQTSQYARLNQAIEDFYGRAVWAELPFNTGYGSRQRYSGWQGLRLSYCQKGSGSNSS